VPKAYIVPRAVEPGYLERLVEICRKEACSLLFPGLDPELPVLAENRGRFEQIGTTVVVSRPEVIRIADDKQRTADFVRQLGLSTPTTYPFTSEAIRRLPFPFVAKPREGGSRSQGVFLVRSQHDLEYLRSTLEAQNYVAQEHIEGGEYTCGTVSVEGECYGPIVMRRDLRNGDTYKATVVSEPRIQGYVRRVAEALGPFGPCNFQLRLREAVPYLLEINARCSGTTYCRTLAGFNEPVMVADLLTQGKRPTFDIRELTILRYWNELLVHNECIETLRRDAALEGSGQRL
jgi:carbamoyl-phosphate synthase large subunit